MIDQFPSCACPPVTRVSAARPLLYGPRTAFASRGEILWCVIHVELMPAELENGVLYISEKYRTASHLCCCGCGTRIVTPLKPTGWRLDRAGDRVSLNPSIGNWNDPCKAHYFIWDNRVTWAAQDEHGADRTQSAAR